MSEVQITIDGQPCCVSRGVTVAAALLNHGGWAFSRSIDGAPRGPICGMGICFECRVSIDGQPAQRSCQRLCRDGMEVLTDA